MKKHLALTGFMGAGKSTIGKKLARKLEVRFYDVDEVVTAGHGPVADIFYKQGETQFREYEYAAIAQIVEGDPGVIALGGGAVTYDKTLKLLEKRTYRIFIKVPAELIAGRLRRSKIVRPLIGPAPSLTKIRDLYSARMPRYAHSDFVIEAGEIKNTQIVDRIVDWMHHKHIKL